MPETFNNFSLKNYSNMKSDNVDCKWVKIPNPYIFGIPIQCDEIFVGREVLIKRIIMKLESNPVWVIGQRRMGMTSLLLYIQRHYFKSNIFVSVFLSVEKIVFSSMNDFLFSFCRPITYELEELQYISEEMSEKYLEKIRENGLNNFAAFFERVFRILGKQNRTLVLLIDHHLIIHDAIVKGKIDPQFSSYLGGYLKFYTKEFKIIYSGSSNTETRKSVYSNNVMNTGKYIVVPFLEANDVLKLINKPLNNRMQFEDAAFDCLMDLTFGQPFLCQVILSYLVDKLNKEKTGCLIKKDTIEDGINYYLDQAPHIGDFWYRKVFSEKFNWSIDEEETALIYKHLIISAITDKWGKSKSGLSKEELYSVLELALKEIHKINPLILSEVIFILAGSDDWLKLIDGKYFIKIGLYREWLIKKMNFTFNNTLTNSTIKLTDLSQEL